MTNPPASIFRRLLSGETVSFADPDYGQIPAACAQTKRLVIALNNEPDADRQRDWLGKIIGQEVDESTTVFTPFHINYGKNLVLGKNVFINANCSFLDLGGIRIDDGVMIAPCVSISSEGHPIRVADRQKLIPAPVHIKQNAWIGTNATILAGVTVGENSVVAAGAVVTADVPDNTVVGGVPARIIKHL